MLTSSVISFTLLNINIHSEALCASVVGFSNNCYRCCETIEEGMQALNEFMGRHIAMTPPTPATQTILEPVHVEHRSDPATSADNSWWCCFIGAEPGVHQGL